MGMRVADFSRHRVLVGAALLAALGTGSVFGQVTGQDQASPPPKDTIFARKIIMDSIGSNMDEIETMTSSPAKISMSEAHEHADMISVMLQAFPHLFPPATNQWKPGVERDAGTDTFASPNVWTNYSDFYAQANEASQIALDASRAGTEAEFRTLAGKLRMACDACHASYQKPD
jgi:cytochrome c556